MVLLILKLITAHFITAFLLCRDGWFRAQVAKSWQARSLSCLKSSVVFAFLSGLLVLPGFEEAPLSAVNLVLALLAIAFLRLAVDVIVGSITTSWYGFIFLHAVHICAIGGVLSAFHPIPGLYKSLISLWTSPKTYLIATAYLFSAGFGSLFVPMVTASVQRSSEYGCQFEGMKNAGKYVGVLERILITSLIIFWPKLDAAAIGLVFSAKSIARFPEFRKQHFAEYYLIGTLTSFIIAIFAGLAVRFLLDL
jgi:hypothetical protein